MALILNETSEVLRASGLSVDTTGTNPSVGPMTLLFWIKKSASGNDTYATPAGLSGSTANRTSENCLIRDTTWKVQNTGSGQVNFSPVATPADDVWEMFGWQVNNLGTEAQFKGTVGGAVVLTGAALYNGVQTYLTLGRVCTSGSTTQYNGKIAHVRIFESCLSEAQLNAERTNPTPQVTAKYVWPLVSDLIATTGEINIASVTGTATFDSDTPYGGTAIAVIASRHYARMRG